MPEFDALMLQSVWIAGAALLVVFAGAVVQAGLGMGFGLAVAPILALLDPVLVPVTALFLGTATSIFGAMKERENIVWRQVDSALSGRLGGIFLGLFLLAGLASAETFSLLFGCVILVAVAFSLVGWRLMLNVKNLFLMGVVSGFMGAVTSVSAPPMALIYQHQPASETRASLASYFAIGGLLTLAGFYLFGLGTFQHIWLSLILAPAAVFGTWVGRRYRDGFDSRYRGYLLFVAASASLLLIIRGLA